MTEHQDWLPVPRLALPADVLKDGIEWTEVEPTHETFSGLVAGLAPFSALVIGLAEKLERPENG